MLNRKFIVAFRVLVAHFTAATSLSLADEFVGQYRQGPYSSGGSSIYFVAFTFTGELRKDEVERHFLERYREIKQAGKTSKITPRDDASRLRSRAVALRQGDILVVGFVEASTRRGSWLAADVAERAAFPRHNWLCSNGDRGTIRSDNPGPRQVQFSVRPGGASQPAIHLGVYASSGWIRWANEWEAEPPLESILIDE